MKEFDLSETVREFGQDVASWPEDLIDEVVVELYARDNVQLQDAFGEMLCGESKAATMAGALGSLSNETVGATVRAMLRDYLRPTLQRYATAAHAANVYEDRRPSSGTQGDGAYRRHVMESLI